MLRTEKKVVLKNENGIKLCKFDFALVVVLLTSNKNVKTVDLRNTYEVAEADELEQKDKVEITEFLCNLLMNKKKETNFDLKLEWNHLDIECILSFFKTKHDCLPTALDISTSNPESNMEQFDEFSNCVNRIDTKGLLTGSSMEIRVILSIKEKID